MSAFTKNRSRSYAVNCELAKVQSEDLRVTSIHYIASAKNPADAISRGCPLDITDLQLAVDILKKEDLGLADQKQELVTQTSPVPASNAHDAYLYLLDKL